VSETLRTFVALPLPDELRAAVAETAAALRAAVGERDVRWVRPEGVHLTLAFLGDTTTAQVAQVRDGLEQVAGANRPVPLRLDRVGVFPHARRPRVFWVGIRDDADALHTLQRAVTAMLTPLGWAPDRRPFTAHLTLGRVRGGARVAPPPADVPVTQAGCTVDSVVLYRSELRRDGARYTVLHRAKLAG
jgi:2'-5' RNA ligase